MAANISNSPLRFDYARTERDDENSQGETAQRRDKRPRSQNQKSPHQQTNKDNHQVTAQAMTLARTISLHLRQ